MHTGTWGNVPSMHTSMQSAWGNMPSMYTANMQPAWGNMPSMYTGTHPASSNMPSMIYGNGFWPACPTAVQPIGTPMQPTASYAASGGNVESAASDLIQANHNYYMQQVAEPTKVHPVDRH